MPNTSQLEYVGVRQKAINKIKILKDASIFHNEQDRENKHVQAVK